MIHKVLKQDRKVWIAGNDGQQSETRLSINWDILQVVILEGNAEHAINNQIHFVGKYYEFVWQNA